MATHAVSNTPGPRAFSMKLILSYVFDWIIIIAIAVVAVCLSLVSPHHRPFSLQDPEIAFPYVEKDTISTSTLVLVSLLAPAIIIVLVCLLLVPGPPNAPKSLAWRRKVWEWNTGWMGLALSLAIALLLTDGMKVLFGKPRPDLLARCNPDLSRAEEFAVGGFQDATLQGLRLVSHSICQNTNKEILDDGFMAFPSGHSSFSFAGLVYLTLFLCSKFAITIPYILPGSYFDAADNSPTTASHPDREATLSTPRPPPKQFRSQAAAPPAYLLVLILIPVCTAFYISSTRYSDFKHHGWDITFGATLGFIVALASFRWYHASLRLGAGWSWGPRAVDKAFWIGVGVHGYGESYKRGDEDVERAVNWNGKGNEGSLTGTGRAVHESSLTGTGQPVPEVQNTHTGTPFV